jgi:Na+/H+ antiporter NhaD/arsenite permease-like protein
MKWIVLAAAVLMYALIIAFPGRKSWTSLGTAFLMVVIRSLGSEETFPSLIYEAGTKLINWDILMIFVGSLVIAELFIYSRVPAVIADHIVLRSPNVGIAIVAILMMTGFISAFVENVATVLVMAPIALSLCRKLKMDPLYFMVGLAVMSNLQGTATLVGDPPSMVFADYTGYGFNDFFVLSGRPSIFFAVQAGMLAGAVFFYIFFARKGSGKVSIEAEKPLSLVPLALLLLMIIGLAVFSFVFGGISLWSGLLVIFLGFGGLLWHLRREGWKKSAEIVKNLDWDTTLFLLSIFVVVGAVAEVGLLHDFSRFLSHVIGQNMLLGFVLIVAVSILISGFVDNVPYIIVMLPVAAEMSAGLGLRQELYMFALLIGSCLGGNLTPFGASTNVVSIGILRKQGRECSFPQWLKIGLPFTLLTTLTSAAFIWIVWY